MSTVAKYLKTTSNAVYNNRTLGNERVLSCIRSLLYMCVYLCTCMPQLLLIIMLDCSNAIYNRCSCVREYSVESFETGTKVRCKRRESRQKRVYSPQRCCILETVAEVAARRQGENSDKTVELYSTAIECTLELDIYCQHHIVLSREYFRNRQIIS